MPAEEAHWKSGARSPALIASLYFGGPNLGAIRIDDFKFQFYQQPWGWPGEKTMTDMPTIVNIRQEPFGERRRFAGSP